MNSMIQVKFPLKDFLVLIIFSLKVDNSNAHTKKIINGQIGWNSIWKLSLGSVKNWVSDGIRRLHINRIKLISVLKCSSFGSVWTPADYDMLIVSNI